MKKGKNNPWKGYPYNSGEIPEDAKPDEKILKHYLKKYISYSKLENRPGFKIKKSKSFKKFEFDLRKDEYVIKQLNKTALLSYLEYVNGKIVGDVNKPTLNFRLKHKLAIDVEVVPFPFVPPICIDLKLFCGLSNFSHNNLIL